MNNKRIYIAGGVLAVVFVLFLIVNFLISRAGTGATSQNTNSQSTNTTPAGQILTTAPTKPTTVPIPPGVVAMAGTELIYEDTVRPSLRFYAKNQLDAAREQVINVLIDESVILQEGERAGLVSLTPEIFNSSQMNRAKRTAEVLKLTEQFKAQLTGTIDADVVTLWYKNAGTVSTLGLEAGAKKALEKLTSLHAQVKAGTMTMQQAAQDIRSDATLAQLDPNYQNNALFQLQGANDDTTGTSQLINKLFTLETGQLSDIFLVKTDKGMSEYYAFAKLTNKTKPSGTMSSYDAWLKSVRKTYETKIY